MTPPLPEPMYRRLSDLQSGIDDWYSPSQMTEYGKACAAAAIKELAGDSDLTIAYLDGLHTGRKQEQDRILRIVQEEAPIWGNWGKRMEIGIRAKVRSHIEDNRKLVTKPDSRPQNCGTGHCSCIECPYPKQDWSAA